MKKISFLVLLLSMFLSSCGEVTRGLTGEKKLATDQFLVKKKKPLVLPPKFDELPVPKNTIKKEIDESEKIEKIINVKGLKVEKKNKSSSLENSILKKIKD